MKTVIFLDFDGVVRHWSGTDVYQVESSLGLQPGALFDVAFLPKLLTPAITGLVTDQKWRANVQVELKQRVGSERALTLMQCWESAAYEIDFRLLETIRTNLPSSKVILTTNATTRLKSDLDNAKLGSYFHAIANSADIGFAKPCEEYFRAALTLAKCSVAECVYVDDSEDNIKAAKVLDITSELHTDAERTIQFLEKECR